jgi:hypothetical protein
MNRFLPLALLVFLIVVFRCIGSAFPYAVPNFQPICALIFCGALIARDWRAWALPLAAWFITYPVPALLEGDTSHLDPKVLVITALAFAVTFFIGKSVYQKNIPVTLAGSIVAALVFHLITNSAAWIGSPLYPKTPEGLIQSLWTGPVGGT